MRTENQTIKMKILRKKYLQTMQNNYFFKSRKSLFELKKDRD